MKIFALAGLGLVIAVPAALAGTAVPLPAAGALGPVGLGIAAVGYVGYRLFRRR